MEQVRDQVHAMLGVPTIIRHTSVDGLDKVNDNYNITESISVPE
jgi:hypothetical protein